MKCPESYNFVGNVYFTYKPQKYTYVEYKTCYNILHKASSKDLRVHFII